MSDDKEATTSTASKKEAIKKSVTKKDLEVPSTSKAPSVSRPKVDEMVDNALTDLHHRTGTTIRAVRKHISDSYKCDEKQMKRMAGKIKEHVLDLLENETLVQLKGKGASGTFKLSQKPIKRKKKEISDEDKSSRIQKKEKEIKKKEPKIKKSDSSGKKESKSKTTSDKVKKARKSIGVTAKLHTVHAAKVQKTQPKAKKGAKIVKGTKDVQKTVKKIISEKTTKTVTGKGKKKKTQEE